MCEPTQYLEPTKARQEVDFSQVKQGGAELIGLIEEYDYGRFGSFMDPDGDKVELWETAP